MWSREFERTEPSHPPSRVPPPRSPTGGAARLLPKRAHGDVPLGRSACTGRRAVQPPVSCGRGVHSVRARDLRGAPVLDLRRYRSAVAALDERASWIVTTTTRSSSSMKTYTISIQRHGPSTKRKSRHRPVNHGPRRGKRRSGASERLTRRFVSVGRLCVRISLSRSATAAAASSTRGTDY